MNTVNHQMLLYIVYLFTDINQFFFPSVAFESYLKAICFASRSYLPPSASLSHQHLTLVQGELEHYL